MSTHLPGFKSYFRFLHHFVLVKLASSSTSVEGKRVLLQWTLVPYPYTIPPSNYKEEDAKFTNTYN